jgi:Periplasmic component of the Tol biopolymer transport system
MVGNSFTCLMNKHIRTLCVFLFLYVTTVCAFAQPKTPVTTDTDNRPWIVTRNGCSWLFDSDSGNVQPLRGICNDLSHFSPDGKYLFSTESSSKDLFVYEIATGQLKRFKNRRSAFFSPDSQWLIASNSDNHLLHKLSTGENVRELEEFRCFFDDKSYLVDISRYDLESGNLLNKFRRFPNIISSDGKIVVCEKEVINMETGQLIREEEKYSISTRIFLPDSQIFLGRYYDKEEGEDLWGLFDVVTGTLSHKFKGKYPKLSPDGKLLALEYHNNNFDSRLFDITTGQRIDQFKGHGAYRHVLSTNSIKFLQRMENLFGKEFVQQLFDEKKLNLEDYTRKGFLQITRDGDRSASKYYQKEFIIFYYYENYDLVRVGMTIILPSSDIEKFMASLFDYDKLFNGQSVPIKAQIQKEQDDE